MIAFYNKSENLLPGIILSKETGEFKIFGTSCPLDPFEFYDPVFEWFENYMKDPLEETVLDLNMTYFNTASAKYLLRFIINLNHLTKKGYKVKIRWFYSEEDDDMKEEGEEFKNMVDADFELIPLEDDPEGIESFEFDNII